MKPKVLQINEKPKVEGEPGLPKKTIPQTTVRFEGVGNDYNNYRQESKGGTLDRAVLIMTTDKFEELSDEGWPVQPGDLGENITIEGLDYDTIAIGDFLEFNEVKIQITEPCNPCSNLRALHYVGNEHIGEFISTMKGRRGWYAKVIAEGNLKTEEMVRLIKQNH